MRRDEGHVAILTLNRPDAMNALSGELIDALTAEFDRLSVDNNIRCVIIEAKGRAFSTGHDLREVASRRDYAFHHDLLTRCSAMMLAIHHLPQPVIAKGPGDRHRGRLAKLSPPGDLAGRRGLERSGPSPPRGINNGLPKRRSALGPGRPQCRTEARDTRRRVHRPVGRCRDGIARRPVSRVAAAQAFSTMETMAFRQAHRRAKPPGQIAEGKAMFHKHHTEM